MGRPGSVLAALLPAVLAAGGAGAACIATDPLLLTRAGADVDLQFTADARDAAGYSLFRVGAKSDLPGIPAGPEYRRIPEALPTFPLIDRNAVNTPLGVLFYQLYPRCAIPCVRGSDQDGDRLDDCVETGTGVFNGPQDTGTSPTNADSDDDGISDGDEVLGTADGLDLPALGASPVHKDIFIEYDWFDDSLDCGPHSHRPTQAIVDRVTAAFAAAPLINPDGTSGIRVHHDYGQGAPFTGGNRINDPDGVLVGDVADPEFRAYKLANSAANRLGYFHYAILPHRFDTSSNSSGYGELLGNDLIISLQCEAGNTAYVANTILHDLGHNLGLRHGGDSDCNNKPNYNSVMNYRFQFAGVDFDCDALGDGPADYSHGTNLELDESDLDERAGVCGVPAIDWNGDSVIETGVVFDVNPADAVECDGAFTVLTDYDDWAAIDLTGILDGDFAPRGERLVCDNPTP